MCVPRQSRQGAARSRHDPSRMEAAEEELAPILVLIFILKVSKKSNKS